MKKFALLFSFLALLCAMSLCMVRPPEAGGLLGENGTQSVPGVYGSGAQAPGGGSCASTGATYPDNPFKGWPVGRFAYDWRTISSWFCDPDYFRGYTHWGIDLAAQVTIDDAGATGWNSIDDAEVFSQAPQAVVKSAVADGGPHHGMGNHVIVAAVECVEMCGQLPDPAVLTDTEHVYELGKCQAEEPTPDPYQPPDMETPTPLPPQTSYLYCVETGWRASFFHLRSISVAGGQLVTPDMPLGKIDSTGNSTGTHLHYQINSPTDGAIDPAPAMCADYSDELRGQNRYHRPICSGAP